MSVRELLLDLSNETSCTEDFQIVSLEGSVKDELRSADKVRLFRKQLSELSNKVESLSTESSGLNNFATDVLQMNYRHIMQNAGLSSEVVSFESNDKNSELNFLSKEVNKAISNTDGLEDKILDFSPEGKILSFFRRDKSTIESVMRDLKKLEDPSKKNDFVELSHKSVMKFLWRDDKLITNLESEIKKEVKIILDAEDEVVEILNKIKKMVSSNTSGSELKPVIMKIFKEKLLGNRSFGRPTGSAAIHGSMDSYRLGGYLSITPLLASSLIMIIGAPIPPVHMTAIGLQLTSFAMMKVNDLIHSEKDVVNVKLGSFGAIRSDLDKLSRSLTHNKNSLLFSEIDDLLKKFTGEDKNNYKNMLSALAEVQELLYEHSIWVMQQMKNMLSKVK